MMINKISIKRNCHFRIDFIIRKTKLLIYLENDIIERKEITEYITIFIKALIQSI